MSDFLRVCKPVQLFCRSLLVALGSILSLVGCQQPTAQPTVVVVPTPSQGSFRAPPPVMLPKSINASNIVGTYVQDERLYIAFLFDRQMLNLPLAHCRVPRGKETAAIQSFARILSNQVEIDWVESFTNSNGELQVVLKYHNGFARRNLARSITRELAGLTAP